MGEGSAQSDSLDNVSWQSIAAIATRHAAPCHAPHGHAGPCMAGDLQAVLMVHGLAIHPEPADTAADLTCRKRLPQPCVAGAWITEFADDIMT